MTELERALARLDIDWPETPAFDLSRRPARRRWPVIIALAAVLAVGAAFAVPSARSAILRFFHLRGVSIERVETLPAAAQRSLRASLGTPISRDAAEQLLGRPFALPGVRVYRAGIAVSALVDRGLILTELRTGPDAMILKKYASGATQVEAVTLGDGIDGIWIHGGRHLFMAPQLPPRYAGNVLLWQRGAITYRLEGRGLTLERAKRLSEALP